MANVSVYNMEGKEVGTMELNDAVFGVEVNEHLVHRGSCCSLQTIVREHRKLRHVPKFPEAEESLETERNWSCKTGFNKSSPVDRRRRCIRSRSKRLLLQDEQEGKESCS